MHETDSNLNLSLPDFSSLISFQHTYDSSKSLREQVNIFESWIISQAIKQNGSLSKAAKKLDIDRSTLIRKRNSYKNRTDQSWFLHARCTFLYLAWAVLLLHFYTAHAFFVSDCFVCHCFHLYFCLFLFSTASFQQNIYLWQLPTIGVWHRLVIQNRHKGSGTYGCIVCNCGKDRWDTVHQG